MSRRKKNPPVNPPQYYAEGGKIRIRTDHNSNVWTDIKSKISGIALFSLGIVVLAFVIKGYLETRVNTPFDSKVKVS